MEHRLYLLHCELSNCGSWALVKFSSVTQSCPTLCDPMDQSMPGLPVHHQLTESTQTQLQSVGDAIQLSKSSVIPFSSCLQSFPASVVFSNKSALHIRWPKHWSFISPKPHIPSLLIGPQSLLSWGDSTLLVGEEHTEAHGRESGIHSQSPSLQLASSRKSRGLAGLPPQF